MPAYFIFNNRITDPDGMADYVPKALETLAAHDAEIVVFDEEAQVLEGTTDFPRMIIVKFKSRDDAETWYNSQPYSELLPLRLAATEGVSFLVDHWEPPAG